MKHFPSFSGGFLPASQVLLLRWRHQDVQNGGHFNPAGVVSIHWNHFCALLAMHGEVKKMKKDSGFTLLEAIIVLAIMMIGTLGVPALHSYFDRQGAGLAAERLRGDLQMARFMAINKKQTCSVFFNKPGPNQYINSLNQQVLDLSGYHGGVNFPNYGPDGRKNVSRVAFNRQGMSTSAVPVYVYLADQKRQSVYCISIYSPGGISVARWNGSDWR
ncbi:MAG: hypothetical protein C4519_20135 [Desulfobacteraceae bacterium]|nr:MAG: hypothetical protein C4519_20135 [Desulfobacteraceae bacterium]